MLLKTQLFGDIASTVYHRNRRYNNKVLCEGKYNNLNLNQCHSDIKYGGNRFNCYREGLDKIEEM